VAVALLLVSVGATVALLAASAGAAPQKAFHYTHRVAMTGTLVDHWTVNDPEDCGLVGDGTMTVKFRMAKSPKVRLVIDPVKNGEPNNSLGSWVLGVPVGGGIGDLPYQPATGTITLVDNTTLRPRPSGGDCGEQEKADCGTSPLVRGLSKVAGYNRRQLFADLSGVEFTRKGGHGRAVQCGHGQVAIFSDAALVGGTRRGELLLRMPSASTVAHRGVLHVSGRTHKHTSYADCGAGPCSDDVTRTVSVTFTKL
jgi:hypothetical protein